MGTRNSLDKKVGTFTDIETSDNPMWLLRVVGQIPPHDTEQMLDALFHLCEFVVKQGAELKRIKAHVEQLENRVKDVEGKGEITIVTEPMSEQEIEQLISSMSKHIKGEGDGQRKW